MRFKKCCHMKKWVLFSFLSAGILALLGAPDIGRAFHKLWLASQTLGKPKQANAFRDLHTWLPDRGLRGLYGNLRGHLSYQDLEKLIEIKIFLKGPHTDGKLNLTSNQFGHYNPAFPRWLKQNAIPGRSNPKLRALYQPIYDLSFRRMARTYYLAHRHLHSDPMRLKKIHNDYIGRVKNEEATGQFLGDAFRAFADQMENNGYDWYEANTAPGFWLRRSIDGTDNEFHAGLVALLETHDAAFLKQHR